jgi:hypothetical protein
VWKYVLRWKKTIPNNFCNDIGSSFWADSKLSTIKVAAPPLGINPSLSLSKGLDAFVGSSSLTEKRLIRQSSPLNIYWFPVLLHK